MISFVLVGQMSATLPAEQRTMVTLTLNSGSASIKFSLYDMALGERAQDAPTNSVLILAGSLQRVGLHGGRFTVSGPSGVALIDETRELPDTRSGLDTLLRWLTANASIPQAQAIGHRIVHGGPRHTRPERITPQLLVALRELIPLAPEHLPAEIAAIEAACKAYPDVPQIACFDTAFHRDRPEVAQIYGLPWHYTKEGVLRYGFHGLSYEYIVQELARETGSEATSGRLVVAHLGNGSSMAAIRGGHSMDATMGFTPLSGLVMSTRPGDLDPGLLLYLLDEKHLTQAQLRALFSEQSGLLGVSGISSDMRDLLARERDDPRAALAVDLYCYSGRKAVGALAAVLGGIDTLVFTAGIGEHAPPIREPICAGLEFLGISVDSARNAASAPIISPDGAEVTVRVAPTNEELMIARHTRAMLNGTNDSDVGRH
jgi:acetate kinase